MALFSLTPFFQELDLLEIRLATLDEVVDYHVIAEAPITHSGKPRDLLFADNIERFRPWAHKIRYLIVDDMPDEAEADNTLAWTREMHQRNSLVRALTNEELAGDHMVLVSDLDEIPSPEVLRDITARNAAEHIHPPMYVYHLNWRWPGAAAGTQATCVPMRMVKEGRTLQSIIKDTTLAVHSGERVGWHFAYMGGKAAIQSKLESFAHEELADERFTADESIAETLRTGRDLFHRDRKIVEAPLGDLPKYVQENIERFRHLLHHEPNPALRLPKLIKQHPGGTIAVPTNETLRFTDFAVSLTAVHAPPDTKIVWQKGSSVVRNRNALCRTYTGEWVWFMDDDHKFPPTILYQLLDHEVDVVVPLCFKRYFPYDPVIYSDYREEDVTGKAGHVTVFLDEHPQGGLIEVYAAGTAGMLIRRHVLDAVGDPWFEDHVWGEDLSFCKKVREAGFKIYCDLDSHLGHMNVYTVWPTRHENQWGMTFDSGSQNGQFFIPTEDYHASGRAKKENDDIMAGKEPEAVVKRSKHRRRARSRR